MSPKEVKMCKIVEQISHSLFYVSIFYFKIKYKKCDFTDMWERERERERVNKSIYPLTHEMLNLDNYIFLLKKCATWPNRKLLYQKFILIVKINKCKIMIDFSNLHQISVGCATYIYIKYVFEL